MSGLGSAESRFGIRVRLERERRKWSQAELAQRVSSLGVVMHPTTVTKIESRDGERPRSIRLDEAYAFAAVFETSIDALIGSKPQYDGKAIVEEVSAAGRLLGARLVREQVELEGTQEKIGLYDQSVDPTDEFVELQLLTLHLLCENLGELLKQGSVRGYLMSEIRSMDVAKLGQVLEGERKYQRHLMSGVPVDSAEA